MTPRTALIPGGVRGIGRAVALGCLADGWRVAVCHRRSFDDAASLAREAGGAGDRLLVVTCDVTVAGEREALVAAAQTRFGAVDALVHAAGPFARGPLLTRGVAAWRDAWESNLVPLVALCEALVPAMAARGFGRVVGFAMAGVDRLAPAPTVAPYAAAKAGVVAFVRALAREVTASGVTANVVSPGVIDTGGVAPEVLAHQVAKVPLGRAGTPDEAAAVVRFLLRDEAGYVSGANIDVAGAWGL